jgi:hypothetical protein
MPKAGKRFFTYLDHKKDDGKIFYVGKGNEYRITGFERNQKYKNIVNKYGLYREIIEVETEQLALQLENFLMKEHHTYVDDPLCDEHACNFKTSSDYVRGEYSQEARDNMRKAGSLPVNKYDLTGKWIDTFDSIKSVREITGKSGSVGTCCKGLTKQASGFLWRFVSDEFPVGVDIDVEIKDTLLHINKYDLSGRFIETCHFSRDTHKLYLIIWCCNGQIKSSCNFMWRWHKDYVTCEDIQSYDSLPELSKKVRQKRRKYKILQLTLDDVEINRFDTIYEASILTGVNRCSISQCCLGRGPKAGGFKWKRVYLE